MKDWRSNLQRKSKVVEIDYSQKEDERRGKINFCKKRQFINLYLLIKMMNMVGIKNCSLWGRLERPEKDDPMHSTVKKKYNSQN